MRVMRYRIVPVVFGFLVAIAFVFGGSSAWAFKRKSTVSGPGGKSATQEVDANRTPTGYNRSSTTTGPNDKSVNTQSQGTWNASTKTWTKQKSATGPKGQTKSYQKATTVTK